MYVWLCCIFATTNIFPPITTTTTITMRDTTTTMRDTTTTMRDTTTS
jgi:hypothetical protein